MTMKQSQDRIGSPVRRLVGQVAEPVQLDQAVSIAKAMTFDTAEQAVAILSLLFHVDRLLKLVDHQNQRLSFIYPSNIGDQP